MAYVDVSITMKTWLCFPLYIGTVAFHIHLGFLLDIVVLQLEKPKYKIKET